MLVRSISSEGFRDTAPCPQGYDIIAAGPSVTDHHLPRVLENPPGTHRSPVAAAVNSPHPPSTRLSTNEVKCQAGSGGPPHVASPPFTARVCLELNPVVSGHFEPMVTAAKRVLAAAGVIDGGYAGESLLKAAVSSWRDGMPSFE